VVHRYERITIAAGDEGWAGDPAEITWREQRLDGDVRGNCREQPPPGSFALAAIVPPPRAAAKVPVPLTTSQTALWTGDSCVGEKRICKRPALGNSR